MSTKAAVFILMVGAGISDTAFGQPPQGPVKYTLDQAIQMAVQHNHALLAARTTVQQSLAQEVTANLRPNPELAAVWAYLPLFKPEEGLFSYLHDSTEFDLGLSYTDRTRPEAAAASPGCQGCDGCDPLAGGGQRAHA